MQQLFFNAQMIYRSAPKMSKMQMWFLCNILERVNDTLENIKRFHFVTDLFFFPSPNI